MYKVELTNKADADIKWHSRCGKKAITNKIRVLMDELAMHPRTGTGQVEHLKYQPYPETWSRRLNKEHRMVYEIHDDKVIVKVLSAASHYGVK